MSNSRPPNSALVRNCVTLEFPELGSLNKTEISGSTIGFRFHANEEQLEEVQSRESNYDVKEEKAYLKMMTEILKPEVLDGGKAVILNTDAGADGLKDQRKLLGKRSVSVDSASESPFTNPIERWKKFSEFREKITKTVEEKISEMKMERNVLGKTKLIHSKENSSISDSEDTSESSKMSEQYKDVENQIVMPEKIVVQNSEAVSVDTSVTPVKKDTNNVETKNELRNRKSFTHLPDVLKISDIKIAVAKDGEDSSATDVDFAGEVESGVEAEENLNKEESDSLDLFDVEPSETGRRGSNTPPYDGSFGSNIATTVLTQTNAAAFLLLFFLYIFIPLPEFIKGCILSFLLMIFWGSVKNYIACDDALQQRPFVIPDYKTMPPLKVPKSDIAKGVWFNEYEEETYDPDYYSVTNTVPVYLELQGNTLIVSRAKGKIRRRATYDEPEYKLPIISRRVFNMKGCNVYLMPEGLTRKRLFSKKYPIVILLKRDSLISETRNGKEIDDKELQDCFESDTNFPTRPISPRNRCTLFLFARCDRQKEEWYRRLLVSTKAPRSPVHACPQSFSEVEEYEENDIEKKREDSPVKEQFTPFETLHDEIPILEEYFRYMAIFASVKTSDGENEVEEDSASQTQLQWINALINRILFDVFRSPFWLAKIQEKLQRKMNSIRMPYYIEDIEVIEMDLGKTGPMFHRVSAPYMDDRGLWFDMDLTFNGLIRLTVQTQLNLVKLQKGIEENEAEEAAAAAAAAAQPEKMKYSFRKKGKKTEKTENELNPNVSTEICPRFPSRPAPPEVLADKVRLSTDSEPRAADEYTEKLMREVSQLAEFAVQEVISGGKDKGLENTCLCAKKEPEGKDCSPCPCNEISKNRSPIYDSDVEDSAESSSEDEDEVEEAPTTSLNGEETHSTNARRYPRNRRSSKRIFKMFENVAQSKYFRTMAQSKYVQKAIAGVSAAKLRLTLEIKSCTGILAVNIPPPPSDRFWYGFRKMPTLIFSANPKIGDKAVRFIHIRNYLQKKILYELKKVMVAPNMIDFVLPTSAPARGSGYIHVEEPDMQEETLSD